MCSVRGAGSSGCRATGAHPSAREPAEPLRWLGINGARVAVGGADPVEDRTGRVSWRGRLVDRLLPH